ncbi:MAG: tetratricopeptide repeat protein [Chloroflexota bacterium]
MSVLKIFFFGSGQVLLPSGTEAKIQSRKEFGLLAYLAVEHGRAHTRESILGLFWPELSESQARNNLRGALHRLRKSLNHANSPLILSDRLTIQFDPQALQVDGAAWLDVAAVERLISAVNAHDHTDLAQCPACLADLSNAVDLYQGEFLHSFHIDHCEAFEQWLLIQREHFHSQAMALLPKLEEAHMANQDWNAAETAVRRRLTLDPLDEDAHRTLMRVFALSGLRNAALSHYDIFARTLDEELGVPPSEEIVALMRQIRKGNLRFKIDDSRLASVNSLNTRDASPIVNPQSTIVNLDPYAILNRLDPLPDQTLFGAEKALATVGKALDASNRSWLVSIEGIGGLGKTTLAHALVKGLIEQGGNAKAEVEPVETEADFDRLSLRDQNSLQYQNSLRFQDIGWVSAKQEEYLPDRGVQATGKPALDEESLMDQLLAQLSDGPYPTGSSQEKRLALTQLLKKKVCFVVIDNLETAVDYETLLPLLRHLANPSKFLITSRLSLSGQGDVFCYGLSELNEADALAFLRHEATIRGMAGLTGATDDELLAIYATVGGNPLALKLVLGQIQFLPLAQLLTSLRQADTERIDQFYTYIYWQAWQMLDQPSRHVLLCLPVVPNATFAQLLTASGLEPGLLRDSLLTLGRLSLVEMGSDLSNPRYHLHRLTETFLMYEVVKWQEAEWQRGKVSPTTTFGDEFQGQEGQRTDEAEYFIQRVLYMVKQWYEAEPVHELDVTILDHEFESVVKAISLGLELEEGWPTVKPLIIAFTPFMERRGHWHTWHSILERSIDAARRAKDLDGEITLTALLARLCQRESRPKEVVYYYRRVIRMARHSGNRFEEARACSNLGYAYIDGGRWWRSEVLSCHALAIFEELESEHGRAHTHNHLGLLYTRESMWDKAEEHLLNACELWEAIDDYHSKIYGLENLGVLYCDMNKPKQALFYLEQALNQIELTGEENEIGSIWGNIGIAYKLTGNSSKAEIYMKKAESQFRQQSNITKLAQVWENLGQHYCAQKNWDFASEYLESSLKTYRDLHDSYGEIKALMAITECEYRQQNWTNVRINIDKISHLMNEAKLVNRSIFEQHLERYRHSLQYQ